MLTSFNRECPVNVISQGRMDLEEPSRNFKTVLRILEVFPLHMFKFQILINFRLPMIVSDVALLLEIQLNRQSS